MTWNLKRAALYILTAPIVLEILVVPAAPIVPVVPKVSAIPEETAAAVRNKRRRKHF